MTATRDHIIERLWRGRDPFLGFPARLYAADHGGWGSNHPYLADAVARVRPRIVVEIGVWNGGSSRTLATALRDHQVDGAVIAVDTWLGSSEHWLSDHFESLHFAHGYPTKQRTFMTNVVEWGLAGYIVPLPLDSLNAAAVLEAYGLQPDVLHLDGSHDYESVAADLRTWWPRLRGGGMLIGDDYHEGGAWPGVKLAFDSFFGAAGLARFEHHTGKCRILKR